MFNRARLPSLKDGPVPWFEVKMVGEDEATVWIYEEIGGFFGVDATELVRAIAEIRAPTIRMRIHSRGGDVFDAFAIFNALRAHPARVIAQIDHSAFSAASYLALAGDHITMPPNGLFMIHDPSTMVAGTAAEMRQIAELLDKVTTTIVETYVAHSNLSEDEIRAAMAATTFYSAAEALEAGFIDEVTDQETAGESAADKAAREIRGAEREEPIDGEPLIDPVEVAKKLKAMQMRLRTSAALAG